MNKITIDHSVVEQEPVASIYISANGEREMDDWRHDLPVGSNFLYASPQNLHCKSEQARLAALWGYEKPQQEQEWKRRLGNLLAVIHGDGGHYIDAHGWDKAQVDAEEKIARIMTERNQPVEQEPEYWRPVVGFEGLYEVSSRGDIRNLKTNAVLAKNKMGAGYIKADLWKLGTRTQTSAHRIVAEAFLGNTKGLEVNHINGDKSDNRVSNLEIVTKNENESHSRYILGNLVKPVIARNLTSGTEFEFKSVNAARAAGFLPSSVYKCCYGICKQHKGHAFRFKNPDHANGEKVSSVTSPQLKREPLSDEQIKMLIPDGDEWKYEVGFAEATEFARAIERAVLEVRNEIS